MKKNQQFIAQTYIKLMKLSKNKSIVFRFSLFHRFFSPQIHIYYIHQNEQYGKNLPAFN
jgi:hypothetical protein